MAVQYQESDLHFLQRWCEHLGIFYYFTSTPGEAAHRIVFGDHVGAYAVAEGVAVGLPRAFAQLEGGKLNPGGDHVPTFGGEARVGDGGDRQVEVETLAELAVLGGVEGLLEVVEPFADLDPLG